MGRAGFNIKYSVSGSAELILVPTLQKPGNSGIALHATTGTRQSSRLQIEACFEAPSVWGLRLAGLV